MLSVSNNNDDFKNNNSANHPMEDVDLGDVENPQEISGAYEAPAKPVGSVSKPWYKTPRGIMFIVLGSLVVCACVATPVAVHYSKKSINDSSESSESDSSENPVIPSGGGGPIGATCIPSGGGGPIGASSEADSSEDPIKTPDEIMAELMVEFRDPSTSQARLTEIRQQVRRFVDNEETAGKEPDYPWMNEVLIGIHADNLQANGRPKDVYECPACLENGFWMRGDNPIPTNQLNVWGNPAELSAGPSTGGMVQAGIPERTDQIDQAKANPDTEVAGVKWTLLTANTMKITGCGHFACPKCMDDHVHATGNANNFLYAKCPGLGCTNTLPKSDIRRIGTPEQYATRNDAARNQAAVDPNDPSISSFARPCPKCNVPTQKSRECNHMTCDRTAGGCGHNYCWHCNEEYDYHSYSHGYGYDANIEWEGGGHCRRAAREADERRDDGLTTVFDRVNERLNLLESYVGTNGADASTIGHIAFQPTA